MLVDVARGAVEARAVDEAAFVPVAGGRRGVMAVGDHVRELFLEVRADNPGAEALYVSRGFERIAIRAAYYQPDGVDAVVMKAVLG